MIALRFGMRKLKSRLESILLMFAPQLTLRKSKNHSDMKPRSSFVSMELESKLPLKLSMRRRSPLSQLGMMTIENHKKST